MPRRTKINKNTNQNPNQNIINILEIIKQYYAKQHNNIHVTAYERAIYQIKKWSNVIKHGKDIEHLEGIGKGMIQKIDTILTTGTLPIITEINKEINKEKKLTKIKPTIQYTLKNVDKLSISKILGFGKKYANDFQNKYGITTVSQLHNIISQGKFKPNKTQEIGLKYHNHLEQLIPRNEITTIGNLIEKNMNIDINILTFLAGSYPSGLKQFSKDIDILFVSNIDNRIKRNGKYLLDTIITHLQSKLEIISISLGQTKFLGLIKHNNVWRHIDILLVNIFEFPYSYLYFSSGKLFNKLIRTKLKKNGYKLNEWGLFSNDGKQIHLEGELNNVIEQKYINKFNKHDMLEYSKKIEQEIFKLAGIPYKNIRERY
jgi:DNA polymerase IV